MKLYRVAREAPRSHHVVATLLQIVVFWGTFLGLLPWAIHTATSHLDLAPRPFQGHRALAIGLFAIMSALGLGAAMTMSRNGRGTPFPLMTARDLVVAGPYRHLRNPMALAGIGQGIAVGLFLADWYVMAYALSGALLWHSCTRPSEERDLERRFGAAYQRYRDAVPLWRPRWSPWRATATTCGQSSTKSASSGS